MGKAIEAEWDKIQIDYMTGQMSCKELAEKYSISHLAIEKRCFREKWRQERTEVVQKVSQKTIERTVESAVQSKIKLIEEIQSEAIPIARNLTKNVQVVLDDLHGHPMEPSQLQGLAMTLKTANHVALVNAGWVQQTAVDVTSNGLSAHQTALQILESTKLALASGFDSKTIDVNAVAKMLEEDEQKGNKS